MNCRARVRVGRIAGLFGVTGWVKIFSYTEPRENIVHYSPWRLLCPGSEELKTVAEGQRHGDAVIARLQGVEDRDTAAALVGAEIEVENAQLQPLPPDEFYWAQLQGLEVVELQGRTLGRIDHLLRTGAHDVLVVEGERQRLIPFVRGAVVKDIDLEARVMRVDWAPDY
ncbi:MAG: ribosome maturation factor RimM [Gammaproteobacteria bacterium]|nr:ribosome maturation factor RimM [Gammaproteobacteria bacterium]